MSDRPKIVSKEDYDKAIRALAKELGVSVKQVEEGLDRLSADVMRDARKEETSQVLADVLSQVAEAYKDEIDPKSRMYSLVDLGKVFETLGVQDDASLYKRVNAIVPLKRPLEHSINFQVNGKDLSDYCQLESGIAVPEWVAKKSGLPHQRYQPHDSMMLMTR